MTNGEPVSATPAASVTATPSPGMSEAWLADDEQRAWRSFLSASQLLMDALDRQLRDDAGLSHADYEILVRLSEAPDHQMRMSELADQALFSRSRLSHAVGRLEHEGLVRREVCPTDKRGMLAVLTKQGVARLRSAAPEHVAAVRCQVFDRLTSADVRHLERISDAIRQGLEGS